MADLYAAGGSRGLGPREVDELEFWELRATLGQHRRATGRTAGRPGSDPWSEQRAHNDARRAEQRAERAAREAAGRTPLGGTLTPPMPTWSKGSEVAR